MSICVGIDSKAVCISKPGCTWADGLKKQYCRIGSNRKRALPSSPSVTIVKANPAVVRMKSRGKLKVSTPPSTPMNVKWTPSPSATQLAAKKTAKKTRVTLRVRPRAKAKAKKATQTKQEKETQAKQSTPNLVIWTPSPDKKTKKPTRALPYTLLGKYVPQAKAVKIAEGTYGCVYNPPLECVKRRTLLTEITKIMQLDEAAKQLAESKNVKRIDPTSEFTIGEPDMCRPTGGVPMDCKKKFMKPTILVYPYGGPDLSIVLNTMTKENSNTVLLKLGKLIEGLAKMNKANNFHLDIKAQNIVTGVKPSDPYRLIDFGLAVAYPEPAETFLFSSYYRVWAMDSILLSNETSTQALTTHLLKYKADPAIVWFYSVASGISFTNIVKDLEDMKNTMGSSKEYDILRKMDIYSVGRILLDIIYSRYGVLSGNVYKELRKLLVDSKVLHYDSRIRCDATTFSELYNKRMVPLLN